MKVSEAFGLLVGEEVTKLVSGGKLRQKTMADVEQSDIMLLDEISEITSRSGYGGGEVSRQGVQHGLLPLVEGTTVNTKYGTTKTDRVLFIVSGAFHLSKPNDLIPKLRGRFPIRMGLDSLSVEDLRAILVRADTSFTRQYQVLLKTGGVGFVLVGDGIHRLTEIACSINERIENIGARRLYTVMERLLEDLSFHARKSSGETVTIDAAYVDECLNELSDNEGLLRYVPQTYKQRTLKYPAGHTRDDVARFV